MWITFGKKSNFGDLVANFENIAKTCIEYFIEIYKEESRATIAKIVHMTSNFLPFIIEEAN